ncbi:3'-5' exonuclease [Halobacteriovorax sp. GB3]|uniref:3'-5' exonuclease n=1 Tax=Halobacteriovorax sp. GB3 TaxID=2719615 RepID=UPI002360FBFF|nr:3'-5' exonuclease [Halobacteriovorax sp. GB3]MDD0853875.1 3'-5' exonuclease [Halobacteriovorax sp. GB3]
MTKLKEDSLKLLKTLNFCVFDLETTGGNHEKDKIIEIGLVRIRDLKITDKKSYLIQPEIKIPDFIQKLTSIKQKDVEGCPKIEEVIDEIVEFMGDDILVAHNASFDVPFFNSVLKRLKKDQLENKSICTNLMTKYLIPNLMNSNLNYMSKIFGISHKKAHRALDDSIATGKLLIRFLEIFAAKGISKVNHLYYPKNRFELDRVNFKDESTNKEILVKFDQLKTPAIITLKGENGLMLNALPCKIDGTKDKERDFLEKLLNDLPWQVVTIKLVGPFLEALISLNNVFNKIEFERKNELIDFLWETHLPDVKRKHISDPEFTLFDRDFGDFVMTNHLVPEQMIVYPLRALHPKSELVFRYPGHQKKLLQYINSKSKKMSNNKLRKIYYPIILKNFIENYINDCKKTKKDLLVFKKGVTKNSPDNFFSEIDSFLSQNPNPYNYPNEYI